MLLIVLSCRLCVYDGYIPVSVVNVTLVIKKFTIQYLTVRVATHRNEHFNIYRVTTPVYILHFLYLELRTVPMIAL